MAESGIMAKFVPSDFPENRTVKFNALVIYQYSPMEEKKPHFVKRGNFMADDNYRLWLKNLKERYRSSQAKAVVHVNT